MEKLPFIVKQWLVEKEVLSRRVTLNRCLKRISRQIFTKLNMLMSLNMSNEQKKICKISVKTCRQCAEHRSHKSNNGCRQRTKRKKCGYESKMISVFSNQSYTSSFE